MLAAPPCRRRRPSKVWACWRLRSSRCSSVGFSAPRSAAAAHGRSAIAYGFDSVTAFLVILSAYLVGSIPTGVLLGRVAGVDVRKQGSGNIGATNVARTAGRTLGIFTLIGDALKGLVPVLVCRALELDEAIIAAAAVAALCGHVFSVFLGFRGGKGVATGVGVLLGLAPASLPIPLVIFAATMAATRIVSLSSILAMLSAPLAVLLFRYPQTTAAAAVAMTLLILYRHHENISRLIAGTERRFESRK
jgi:glycerol-3-phosphate acyltransferase PlsY